MWNGITTLQFANLCRMFIIDDYFDMVSKEAPTHHFCPNSPINKYKLLQLFRTHFRPDIFVTPASSQGVVSRTLDTQYTSIKTIFEYGNSMEQAITELVIKMKNQK